MKHCNCMIVQLPNVDNIVFNLSKLYSHTVGPFFHTDTIRDGPNVRLYHSAEAEGLGRLTERVPNVRPNFGRMLCSRMKQRLLLANALNGQEMS